MTTSEVQEFCDELVASDPALIDLRIDLNQWSDEELKLIFDAFKKNTSIETLWIRYGDLGLLSTLLLCSAIQAHPTLDNLGFCEVTFDEFTAMATAVKQNDKLSGLRLERCKITTAVNVGLQWLLMEDAIESLVIVGREDGENVLIDLSGGLSGNESLTELILKPVADDDDEEDEDDDTTTRTISDATLHEVPLLVKNNQGIEYLAIYDGMNSDMAKVIVQSVENHNSVQHFGIGAIEVDNSLAESLCHMLENSPALEELRFLRCSISAIVLERLFDSLRNKNSNVEMLGLSLMTFEDDEVSILRNLLETNAKLKVLSLWGSGITDTGAFAIAAGLSRNNHTLETLDMRRSKVGPDGAAAIADSLKSNGSVITLDLGGNKIGDAGIISITEMLVVNSTLETIALGNLTERGMKVFIENLPRVQAVKDVTFTYGSYIPETGEELVKAVEQNTTLEHLAFTDEYGFPGEQQPHVDEIMMNVNYLLALNRAGRKILKCTNVPCALWPRILGRASSNPDAIFFFLLERAASIVGRRKKTTVGKRKREDLDCP